MQLSRVQYEWKPFEETRLKTCFRKVIRRFFDELFEEMFEHLFEQYSNDLRMLFEQIRGTNNRLHGSLWFHAFADNVRRNRATTLARNLGIIVVPPKAYRLIGHLFEQRCRSSNLRSLFDKHTCQKQVRIRCSINYSKVLRRCSYRYEHSRYPVRRC